MTSREISVDRRAFAKLILIKGGHEPPADPRKGIRLQPPPQMKRDIRETDISAHEMPRVRATVLFAVSLAAIFCTFFLATSDREWPIKATAFAVLLAVYVTACSALYFSSRRPTRPAAGPKIELIDLNLADLDDAHLFLSMSINSSDAFRLIASRVNQMVPFDAAILFVTNTSGMSPVQKYGMTQNIDAREGRSSECLAQKAALERTPQVGRPVSKSFANSVAIPLVQNCETFAVLQLLTLKADAFAGEELSMFEAIAERTSGIVAASLSFEQTVSTALTDAVTDLPNERAFHIVLETQLAETQRNRENRPLSILTIDIKNFDEINSRFGHATGDRVLAFVADRIKDQLRQMDFFSRASNDEFLVILPTARMEVVQDVVGRIIAAFANARISVTDTQSVAPDLNFGVATFGEDGENGLHLLAVARERRLQSKSTIPPRVIWFPKEYVN